MTNSVPCADRTNDPQDWFIRPDGKQYTDEDLLSDDERRRVSLSVLRVEGETNDEHEARCHLARNAARNSRKRVMLARRRAAKTLCGGCPIKVECLRGAIERREIHGTWGGMLEEEVKILQDELKKRRRRRGATTM